MTLANLDQKQIEFLQSHHETVEVGVIMLNFFGDSTIIDNLKKAQQFQEIFRDLAWDSIYDSYEEHPDYEPSFRRKFRKQFLNLKFPQ